MHERDARAKDEGVQIPGKQVLPALRHGVNRKLRRQLKAVAGKDKASAKLASSTGFSPLLCDLLLTGVKGNRGK